MSAAEEQILRDPPMSSRAKAARANLPRYSADPHAGERRLSDHLPAPPPSYQHPAVLARVLTPSTVDLEDEQDSGNGFVLLQRGQQRESSSLDEESQAGQMRRGPDGGVVLSRGVDCFLRVTGLVILGVACYLVYCLVQRSKAAPGPASSSWSR